MFVPFLQWQEQVPAEAQSDAKQRNSFLLLLKPDPGLAQLSKKAVSPLTYKKVSPCDVDPVPDS